MATKTLSITAESFENVFVRSAARVADSQRCRSNDEFPMAKQETVGDLMDWRRIAWKALEKKELGDALRCAIVCLSIQYRQVLFLRDVKNLDTGETAWALTLTAGAVRARLSRARMQIYDALMSSLLLDSSSEKSSNTTNYYDVFRAPQSVALAIR